MPANGRGMIDELLDKGKGMQDERQQSKGTDQNKEGFPPYFDLCRDGCKCSVQRG